MIYNQINLLYFIFFKIKYKNVKYIEMIFNTKQTIQTDFFFFTILIYILCVNIFYNRKEC